MSHTNQITVSVVIPTLNRPQIVTKAVRSALAQTLNSIEVIVVVDGPDEQTVTELKKIDDPRLKVKSLPKNVGCADSRNAGVLESKGTWIAFLDDDDEWIVQKLELQLAAAERSLSSYPIIASRYLDKATNRELFLPKRLPSIGENISEFLFVRKSLFERAELIQTSTFFTSRELLLKIPLTQGLRKHVDWDWLIRASNSDGVAVEVLPEVLAIRFCDSERERISSNYNWQFGREWIRSIKSEVTPQAYAGFFLRVLTLQASLNKDWQAFFPLLSEGIQDGNPRLIDLVSFIFVWFFPINIRHKVRSLMVRKVKSELSNLKLKQIAK